MNAKPFVLNLQRTVNVNIPLLESNIRRIKRAMGVEKFRVNVWLRSDRMVQKMNKYDRNVDAPTDVLSYGNLDIAAGTTPAYSKDQRELGDLVFGMGYIESYCEKKGKKLDDYLERLAVHGMCHILGYDHEVDADYSKMRNREHYILRKLRKLKIKEEEEKRTAEILSASTSAVPLEDTTFALASTDISPGKPTSSTLKPKKRTTKTKRPIQQKKKRKRSNSSSSSSSSDSSSSSSSSSSS